MHSHDSNADTVTTGGTIGHHVHVEACHHLWAYCECGAYFCKKCGKEQHNRQLPPIAPGRGPFWQVIS